jgi:hypothetical protein
MPTFCREVTGDSMKLCFASAKRFRCAQNLTKILSQQLREFLDFLQFYIIVYKEKSSEVEWATSVRSFLFP